MVHQAVNTICPVRYPAMFMLLVIGRLLDTDSRQAFTQAKSDDLSVEWCASECYSHEQTTDGVQEALFSLPNAVDPCKVRAMGEARKVSPAL